MALGVRRAGYFEWEKRPKQTDRDASLVSALKEIMYKLTRAQVRIYVFEWIAYYNRKRRHTTNDGKLPPMVKRQLYFQQISGDFNALRSRAG